MPFNTTTGVYTPASGATTANPGDIIKSATWNAIFTDITSALTTLGELLYSKTSVTATPYVPAATDTTALVNVAGVVAVNLPAAASRSGLPLIVKDISGAAHTNNITITPNGVETIEGLASVVIRTDYGGYTLLPVTSGWVISP
jgi:hypothetical protein